jgi:hypothetical protein
MSHEAHHEEHHHEGPQIDIAKSKPAFSASFWFVLILVLLFIAALNFVNVMSQPEEGHGGGHGSHTEAPAHGGGQNHEAAGHEGEMEGGHADAVHPATSTDDQTGDTAAESAAEHH